MPGALTGITVLDLTHGAAGAIATMLLSDHGARVIRVIEHDGAVLRQGGFRVWDRGKEAVRLTGDDNPGRLAQLVSKCDVVMEDRSPDDRPIELHHDKLRAINPRLIACSITAYGEYGPLRNEPAIDDLVLARTGVLSGLPGFRPAPVHTVHPLPSTGAGILAALGVAGALFARQRHGRGCRVATSLVAGALLYHPKIVAENLEPHVFQTNPYGSAPFYSVYRCADDNWIQLGCVHPGFIARAAELMGISDILADPVYGLGHRPQTRQADDHLRGLVTKVMSTQAASEWAAQFEAQDIPFAYAGTVEDSLDDPQIRHNEMVVSLDDPEVGPMEQIGVPIKLSRTPGRVRGRRATTAKDVEALLAELDSGDVAVTAAGQVDQVSELALAGIRVLEITNLIAGPIAGRLLADLGADVIKLEPPGGDISRPIGRTYFYSVNYAKRSIAVDTARDAGKQIVAKLARSCNAMLANLRPGATARMGIGVAFMEGLVETQISGYGLTGPYAHRPGIDPLAQALMGLERAQGGAGNPPSFPAQLAPTDFTTGAMAALGTVLALLAQHRGIANGQRVAVNLLDGGAMLSSQWFTRFAGRPQRPIADRDQYGLSPYHRLYPVADGHVYVAADTPREQQAFLDMFSITHADAWLAGAENAHPLDSGLAKAIAAKLADMECADAERALATAGVAFAPVAAAESSVFFDDPHTASNAWADTSRHPTAGRLTAVAQYIKFGGPDRRASRPTPLLGQHSKEILREAGFDDAQIAALVADGLVVSDEVP